MWLANTMGFLTASGRTIFYFPTLTIRADAERKSDSFSPRYDISDRSDMLLELSRNLGTHYTKAIKRS